MWQFKYYLVAISTDLRWSSMNDVEGFESSHDFQCDIFISHLNTKVIFKLPIKM